MGSEDAIHTFVRFQVRTAATAEMLAQARWHGPGTAAYYERSGENIGDLAAGDGWIQYRFELGYSQGTGNPEVTAVEFR